MKTIFLKTILFGTMCLLSAFVWAQNEAYRQDPRYGSNSDERHENVLRLNFFNEKFAAKQYDEALTFLRPLLQTAPKASQNLYINGATIYKNKIAAAKSLEEKGKYVDTLMMLYDLRMEHFGDNATRGRAYIADLKAKEFLNYKPADMAGVKKMFDEAFTINGANTDPALVILYYNYLVDGYKADEVETDTVLEEFDRLSNFTGTLASPNKDEALQNLEALFVNSGVADCENLEKVYRPKAAERSNDIEFLKSIMGKLVRAECTGPFLGEIGEAIFKVEPSSEVALALASVFEEQNDSQKARQYLNEAITVESDPVQKSNLATRLAGGELGQATPNIRAAVDFARQAIEYNPDNGYAYIFLADAYGRSTAACSGFDRQTAYWIIVDTLQKARALLENEPEQLANIDKQIATYRANFPSKDDLFFHTLQAGDGYTVNCGIVSGRTTVRSR